MSTDRKPVPSKVPSCLIALGVLGMLGIYLVAVGTTVGQRIDNSLKARMQADEELMPHLMSLVYVVRPEVMVLLSALVILAGLRRGWRTTVSAGVAVSVCLVTPQLLKAVLPRPQLADPWLMVNSLPSGHTAAVAGVVVALLIVLPRSFCPAVLSLGTLATMAMGVLVVALGYHRFSDVIASFAVALAGWGAGLLALRWLSANPIGKHRTTCVVSTGTVLHHGS